MDLNQMSLLTVLYFIFHGAAAQWRRNIVLSDLEYTCSYGLRNNYWSSSLKDCLILWFSQLSIDVNEVALLLYYFVDLVVIINKWSFACCKADLFYFYNNIANYLQTMYPRETRF